MKKMISPGDPLPALPITMEDHCMPFTISLMDPFRSRALLPAEEKPCYPEKTQAHYYSERRACRERGLSYGRDLYTIVRCRLAYLYHIFHNARPAGLKVLRVLRQLSYIAERGVTQGSSALSTLCSD